MLLPIIYFKRAIIAFKSFFCFCEMFCTAFSLFCYLEDNTNKKDIDNDDEKAQTRALLVDLKKQLLSKGDLTSDNKSESTAPDGASENMQSKTGLGMKLKLLLQNSAQNRQDKNGSKSESARKTVTARKARSRLQSQQSGYRPM